MIRQLTAYLRRACRRMRGIAVPAALVLAGVSFPPCGAAAQSRLKEHVPIYIVNGERMSEEDVKEIDPADIVSNTLLPADERTVAEYGDQAANGVIVIVLRYDTPARFEVDGRPAGYSDYIAGRVKWDDTDPVARVIVSFTVGPDGSVAVKDVLEVTDKRLGRRILKAMEEAPRWTPALKQGEGVATDHVLRITLPRGRRLPREKVIPVR